jgi:hypothetical protein
MVQLVLPVSTLFVTGRSPQRSATRWLMDQTRQQLTELGGSQRCVIEARRCQQGIVLLRVFISWLICRLVLLAINKTSIKPATYGERFVKRHGLFSSLLRPCRSRDSCVSRKDHDRSAVYQLGKNRIRR